MPESILVNTNFLPFPLYKKGKVRDIYDLKDKLLIIATDRISAFDVILPNGIPYKGKVLTALSEFWFNFTKDIIENHLISAQAKDLPKEFSPYAEALAGRVAIVKKTEVIPVECVARGYLSGSGWKEYKERCSVCDVSLPSGLVESDELPAPIFTPATKAEAGHDINISEKEVINSVGKETFRFLKEKTLAVYKKARDYAGSKGIIIADTKLEFGVFKNKIILIDELLTPDSSRFWPKGEYKAGKGQPSFDKQFVRDYLETLDWDKTPPGPELPPEVIKKTSQKYLDAYKRLTGKDLIL